MAAATKECLVIIIDIRQGGNNFKEKAVKCVSEILKEKICSERKDLITFLLMGAKRTSNSLNTKTGDYENIVEYEELQTPTWHMFCNFLKFVEAEESGTDADWLDALIVALEIQNESEGTYKVPHRRVMLFHNFDDSTTNFEEFDVIANSFATKEIGLIAVSSKIAYITNPKTSEPQAVIEKAEKSAELSESERYALRLVSDCNAKLCNFEEALRANYQIKNRRPWTWNGNLVIGSHITIAITGVIAIKDDKNIKLKKCWGNADEIATRELRTYVKGVEMEPLSIDMIEGYMLGSTPIPFDETVQDGNKVNYQTGLKFLGFPKLNSIPEEYFCGDSLYWIIHRKGMTESAKKLDALVQALHSTERAMLCWKVYSAKFNTPKLVVLLPNEMTADRPASLSMIELTYRAQHHYWDFPALCTEKTKCSKAQLDAIDDLIDSMDLMVETEDEPRQTYESELLAFNALPHIFEKNMMDILERKILSNVSDDDEQFQKMLSEKNFVEVFWKVPEPIEENAKRAASKVRELFPLEKKNTVIKGKAEETAKRNQTAASTSKSSEVCDSQLPIENIGMKMPADDFEKILKRNVMPLTDNTIRDQQFHIYTKQLQEILWELIFENALLELEKIAEALYTYRNWCVDFNAFENFNEWISKVKTAVQSRKELHDDFWHQIVVAKNLGLLFIGQPTLEELVRLDEFYKLDDMEVHNVNADDSINISK